MIGLAGFRMKAKSEMEFMSLSYHQIFMLKHFAIGWKFKQTNHVHGSWNTYWSLRRRGLIGANSVLTDMGRKVLHKELQLLAKRKGGNSDRKKRISHQGGACASQERGRRDDCAGIDGEAAASGSVAYEPHPSRNA